VHFSPHPSLRPPQPGLMPDRAAVRRAIAAALNAAARALQRVARHLGAAPILTPAVALPARLEFHAEPGAPGGALYLDGQLIGHVAGVRRL